MHVHHLVRGQIHHNLTDSIQTQKMRYLWGLRQSSLMKCEHKDLEDRIEGNFQIPGGPAHGAVMQCTMTL